MSEPQINLSEIFTVFLIAGVVLLPWLTLVASELCLVLYRRVVVTSMRAEGVTPPATDIPASGAPRAVRFDIRAAEDVAPAAVSAGGSVYDQWRLAVKDTTKVYLAAGAVYAAILSAAFAFRLRLPLAALPALVLAFSWPTVLTALLVAVPRRRRQVQFVVAYWIVFFIACVSLDADRAVWLVAANIVATVMALVVRARRTRAVAPLVGAFFTVIGVALLTIVGVVMMLDSADPGRTEMSGRDVAIILVMLFALPVAGAIGAWRSLRGIGRWYANKRTSDQTIMTAAIWLIFAGVHATTVGYNDARWMAVGPLAFAGFLATTTAGFRVQRRQSAKDKAPRLLVLRVFALGRHSRRLFDRLAARWRHIGSVQLIAGPDLASSTVEPHEFFDFLSRKLGARFLADEPSVERALADLDTRVDHDGRYRITDFFCRDSVWRIVFSRLAAASDVVLMDLRGFSSVNSGCTFELSELLNLVPLRRVAMVIDGATDEAFLARTIEQASGRMSPTSPNASSPALDIRVFRDAAGRAPDPDRLLRLLCERVADDQGAGAALPAAG
jgi:hypothetical protein